MIDNNDKSQIFYYKNFKTLAEDVSKYCEDV